MVTSSLKSGPAKEREIGHYKSLEEGRVPLRQSRFTEEQVAFALKQAETGTPGLEVCRKLGVSEQTYYRWKKQYGGLGVLEIERLKLLEEENRRLKQLVADLSLDKVMLQDVRAKKL
jgi:putative transposase